MTETKTTETVTGTEKRQTETTETEVDRYRRVDGQKDRSRGKFTGVSTRGHIDSRDKERVLVKRGK